MSKMIGTPLLLIALVACAAADGGDVPADLRAAVSQANEAFAAATRSLNVDRLSEHFDGQILESLSASVARAQQEKRYAVSTLNRIEWIDAEVNGDEADVVTVENWSHQHLRVGTDECLFQIPARDVRQTYRLQRSGAGWKVVGIIDDPANDAAQRTACEGGSS